MVPYYFGDKSRISKFEKPTVEPVCLIVGFFGCDFVT